ncbi:uncharacterized protein MELLADRAFT_118361 [Melampsora larici-populina 98AG31]|uniref:Uncharacterized protein n=1 Tax=Melampsora larici-populina (strain 98AG31 / pathotype 3-4-7) TaxID=747676 RepID=F4S876_MELLP|nr:uncharacterized protein MELLADRAFT_118361 [Melampsora larici-populina 98AG31]EGF99165.1 hypothetical protein MELLADRAFT_118361 [Melampsora larici-populina 98AG31]
MEIELDPTQIPLPSSPPYQQSIGPSTILSIDILNHPISFDNDHNSILNLENNHVISTNGIQSDSEISSSDSHFASCLSAHSDDVQSIQSNPNVNTLPQLDLDSNTLNSKRNSQLQSSSSTHSPDSSNATRSSQSNDSFTATLSVRSLTESNTHTIPDHNASDHDSHFNLPSATSPLSCPTFGHGSINDTQQTSPIDEPDDAGLDEPYMIALDGTLGIDSHQSETTPIASNVTLNESNQQSSHPKTDSADPTTSSTTSIDQSPTSNLVKPHRITQHFPATDINPLFLTSNPSSNTANLPERRVSAFPAPIPDSHTFNNHGERPHHLFTNAVVSNDPTNVPLPPSPPILPSPELPLVIDMISDDGFHQTDHSTCLTSSEHNTLANNIAVIPDSLVHERTLTTIHDMIQPTTFLETYSLPQSEPHMLTDSLAASRRPRLRPPKVPEPRLNDLMNEKPIHSDHYCCFAIPLYNTGIYVILAQFTVFGFVAGVLAFAAPSVIAIAVPEPLTAVMGVLCILVGVFQLMGFYGVYKERVKIFRIYLYINFAFVIITLGYSLVIMILSAQQHSTAIEQCLLQFVSADGDNTETPSNESKTLCNIWTWAQLGICGILWILFGISESYFCFLQRRWSQDQKNDHLKYRSIISAVRESLAVRNSEEIGRRSESNDEGVPRGMNGVVKGGSRLKNEIEWKPILTEPQEEQEITESKSHDSGSGSGSGSSDAEFYRKSLASNDHQPRRTRGDSNLSAPKSILKNSNSRSNSSSTVV